MLSIAPLLKFERLPTQRKFCGERSCLTPKRGLNFDVIVTVTPSVSFTTKAVMGQSDYI